MTTLRIPAEQPWQAASHGRQARTVYQTVRVGWVWGQRLLLALAIILFVTIAVLPQLGLYRPVTVLSGSMRPTFSPGDTILVAPEPVSAVRVGQVVSYQVPVGYTRSRRTASCASCRAALTPLFRLRATRTIGPTHGRQSWKARPPGDR